MMFAAVEVRERRRRLRASCSGTEEMTATRGGGEGGEGARNNTKSWFQQTLPAPFAVPLKKPALPNRQPSLGSTVSGVNYTAFRFKYG